MNVCHICGIPSDAGFFDESNIFQTGQNAPPPQQLDRGDELVLARYEVHRNYCGVLMSFASSPTNPWAIPLNSVPLATSGKSAATASRVIRISALTISSIPGVMAEFRFNCDWRRAVW